MNELDSLLEAFEEYREAIKSRDRNKERFFDQGWDVMIGPWETLPYDPILNDAREKFAGVFNRIIANAIREELAKPSLGDLK